MNIATSLTDNNLTVINSGMALETPTASEEILLVLYGYELMPQDAAIASVRISLLMDAMNLWLDTL